MKQNLRFLMLALLCAVFSTAWGDTETINFSEQGFSNQQVITTVNGTYFSVSFNKGTSNNAPAYYTNGTAVRVYGGGYFTVSSSNTITKIELTFGSSDGSNAITTDVETYEDGTWTGSANSVTFTVGGTTGNRRIKAIAVTFEGQSQPVDKYYVAGTWTDWADGKIEMTKKSNGTYTLGNQQLVAGALFKIIKEDPDGNLTWYGGGDDPEDQYWITEDNHTDISLNGGGGNFYVKIAGTWTFIVDPSGDAPTLTVDGNWPVWEYYLKGDFNEWGVVDSYKFSKVGDTDQYNLKKPIKKGEKFKVYGVRGSEGKWFGAVSNGDFYVEESLVGEELSLTTENGGDNFYMNLSNKNNYWTLEFDPANMSLVLGNYVSDVAELPFTFDGGKGDIQDKAGLTSSGLGSDYTDSPKLKFATTNDALVLHFDERPGTLTFDIKGNPGSGTTITSIFGVQTSEDGETWSTLKTYENMTNTKQSEEFDDLDENVRYIKWVLTEKKAGNVALGNIILDYKKFEFSISDEASDGTDCYATISALDKGNWKVKGNVTVSTVKVNSEGKLEYPIKVQADGVIPGDGAYLVKGAAGTYTFIATDEAATITISEGDNMLLSTGEGNIQTNAPTGAADNGNYKFYKLSLNKKSTPGSVGFYWGASEGAPFTYGKPKQAYLAVPKENAQNVQGFSFDGTTGITEVETAVTGNDEVYTISGMRVDGSNLSKGVYIVNGKKVIIK